MPPQPFIDPASLDFSHVVASHDDIYSMLPHRYEFERLGEIVYESPEDMVMAGYYDVPDDDFWIRGHIPGRPLFPGVMMIETAAQLVSYLCMKYSDHGGGFLGFSAVDGVKFRGSVGPGQRIVMMGKMAEIRPRRCKADTQAFVDGKMVFEGLITGMWI